MSDASKPMPFSLQRMNGRAETREVECVYLRPLATWVSVHPEAAARRGENGLYYPRFLLFVLPPHTTPVNGRTRVMGDEAKMTHWASDIPAEMLASIDVDVSPPTVESVKRRLEAIGLSLTSRAYHYPTRAAIAPREHELVAALAKDDPSVRTLVINSSPAVLWEMALAKRLVDAAEVKAAAAVYGSGWRWSGD